MSLAAGSGQWLRYLDPSEKMPIPMNLIQGKGMNQATLISESGLYKLVMRSDKPQALRFQNWVTKEVLPSIRKTGSFVTGQPSLVENPQMSPLLPAVSNHRGNVTEDSPGHGRAILRKALSRG